MDAMGVSMSISVIHIEMLFFGRFAKQMFKLKMTAKDTTNFKQSTIPIFALL